MPQSKSKVNQEKEAILLSFFRRAGRKWNKTKLLLVEDDQSLGFLMTEFLASKVLMSHYAKMAYQDGRLLMPILFNSILDVMLPGLDGFSLAKNQGEAIRRPNHSCNSPVNERG